MDTEILTRTDLRELTGYVKPSKQIEWLRDRKWPFVIGGDGRARVLRSVRDERMGAHVRRAAPQAELSHLRAVK